MNEAVCTYEYEIPLPNDEEIQDAFKSAGVPDINPEIVRTYIKQCIYEYFASQQMKV